MFAEITGMAIEEFINAMKVSNLLSGEDNTAFAVACIIHFGKVKTSEINESLKLIKRMERAENGQKN